MANNTLAVISQTGETLSFFDIATGARTGHLADLIPEPHELTYDRKRNVLYLTHAYAHGWYGGHGEDGHQISVIDCQTRQVVDVIDISPAKGPHFTILDAERDILYSCVEGGLEGDSVNAGGVIAIDLATRRVVKAILSGYKSHWFVTTPNFSKAYTCNKDGGFISVLDLETSRLLKTISAPNGNEQPSISRDGRFAFFPSPTITVGMKDDYSSGHGVSVIDTSTDEIVHTIPSSHQILSTHVTSSDLLLVSQVRGNLLIFSTTDQNYSLLGEVPVGTGPLTICSDREGKTAFVAGVQAGIVTMVDLEKKEVVRTLEVDGAKKEGKAFHVGAHGMAIVP